MSRSKDNLIKVNCGHCGSEIHRYRRDSRWEKAWCDSTCYFSYLRTPAGQKDRNERLRKARESKAVRQAELDAYPSINNLLKRKSELTWLGPWKGRK